MSFIRDIQTVAENKKRAETEFNRERKQEIRTKRAWLDAEACETHVVDLNPIVDKAIRAHLDRPLEDRSLEIAVTPRGKGYNLTINESAYNQAATAQLHTDFLEKTDLKELNSFIFSETANQSSSHIGRQGFILHATSLERLEKALKTVCPGQHIDLLTLRASPPALRTR